MEDLSFPTINLVKTGKNIERLRKERGISVRELQVYFGFEQPQAIYKWQWGSCLPSVENLYALGKVLHVPMQEILVENDQDLFESLKNAFILFLAEDTDSEMVILKCELPG